MKPRADFYLRADGRLYSWCRDCYKAYLRAYGRSPRGKAATAAYRRTESYKRNRPAQASRARERSPEKFRARRIARGAIRSGRLVRQPCEVCGDPKAEGHHPDYSKPLEVVWLCLKHHRIADAARRAALAEGGSPTP